MSIKYLLDTNVCIYIISRKPEYVFEKFEQYMPGEIAVSAVTACELAFGVEKSGSQRNRDALDKFLAHLDILPLDGAVIRHYARIRQQLQSRGEPIGSLDFLIAAHALSLRIPLVTNNLKEFERVDGLRLENWVE
ncbi:type II toxin-antitoxin system VapC family toxin [Neisseria leonii]|uniref:Ribonuclease VapC n=1 Tax=Neisseria leonii TaxID=2995413 RepID=A0A9X4DZL1_9NEIS|nr:type II toxin-antitoxin system VapC family toxin [Neisseria sp. 51.81]MDD9326722.1 type II toxin-antitoxin system VapC family toxin [Neisseria sp. 51.81]